MENVMLLEESPDFMCQYLAKVINSEVCSDWLLVISPCVRSLTVVLELEIMLV